jgi:hypothetical protein
MQTEDDLAEHADNLAEALVACTNSPLDFVRLAFPEVQPEAWQRRVLEAIGKQLQENAAADRWKAVQIAVASGNGIGKTALLSWVLLWAIITFEDCVGVVTAGSETQLKSRLWGEISKWRDRLPDQLRDEFPLTATALFNKRSERTWRIDARPWVEHRKEAFSGLHNLGGRVVVVFDECSAVPTPIWDATAGMLSDTGTQIIWCVFGNPTRLTGPFSQLAPGGKLAPLWTFFSVDSRETNLADKASIQAKIDYYGGEDSPWCRTHVRGLFPLSDTETLISRDLVERASLREGSALPSDPIVIGADCASGHGSAISVAVVRQGLSVLAIKRYPAIDVLAFAYALAALAAEYGATSIAIDSGGLGEGAAVRLRELNAPVIPVFFGGKSDNPGPHGRAANKRAEMWLAVRAWLAAGSIPRDAELMAELCGPEAYEVPAGVQLERKEDMAKRGLSSPDSADALALTFAYPVFSALGGGLSGRGDHLVQRWHDPFSDAAMQDRPLPESMRPYRAPGWAGLSPEFERPTGPRDPVEAWDPDEQRWWESEDIT